MSWSDAVTTNTSPRNVTIVNDGGNKEIQNPISYLEDSKRALGFLDNLKLDWHNSKEISKQVREITSALLQKQKEKIQHQIMLDLDIDKKRAFESYLSEVQSIEKGIFLATEDAKDGLINAMNERAKEMFRLKKERFKEFEKMASDDEIFEEDAQYLKGMVSNWTQQSAINIQRKLEILLEKHAQTYENTLNIIKYEKFSS